MSDPLRNLTARKRIYVKGIAAGLTKKQAALDAGYSVSVAEKAKSHIETAELRDAFSRLIRLRIPAHKISARIAEGLDAMETKFFQKDGLVTDSRDVINWAERRAYAQLATEFGGYSTGASSSATINAAVGVKVVIEHIHGAENTVTAEAERPVEIMG